MAIETTQLYADDFGFSMCASQSRALLVGNGSYDHLLKETSFGLHQKPHQSNFQQNPSQMQQDMVRFQNMLLDKNTVDSASKGRCSSRSNHNTNNVNVDNSRRPSLSFSQSMIDKFAKHWQEIDQYFISQNEKLRMVLQEQRKQLMSSLLKKLESTSQFLLRQKEEQIEQASRKRMELEMFLDKVLLENEAWQRLAQEKEAIVTSLKNILEQMNERASNELNNNMAEDAESCYEVENAEEARDAGGVGGVEEGTRKTMTVACKICNFRRSCIVFLPCRHLCSCKACEAIVKECPVCRTPKKGTIEALIN